MSAKRKVATSTRERDGTDGGADEMRSGTSGSTHLEASAHEIALYSNVATVS